MGMFVYSSLLALTLLLGAPWWLWQMVRSGRYREGLPQRLGKIPHELRTLQDHRKIIWLHAVSVGEVLAAERLIAELQQALPDHTVVLSTTTATGQSIARQRLPNTPVFFFPLDFAFAVRRYLRLLHPSLLILMESELWPRLLIECERERIPVAVVNARVSDRSLPRYLRLRRLWRPLLAKVTLFLAQTEESADRLRTIGARPAHVQTTGNLKYEAPIAPTPLLSLLRLHLAPGTRLIVCGSTLEGEEAAILAVWPAVLAACPQAVLLLAPRHPPRFPAMAALLRKHSSTLCATSFSLNPAPILPGTIILLDTLGSLAALYELAAVAFIGGSLVPRGGHNPLEAARFGVPILIGQSYENFREIVDGMRAANAIRIVSPGELAAALIASLTSVDPTGERGQEFYRARSGATQKTVAALLPLLAGGSQ